MPGLSGLFDNLASITRCGGVASVALFILFILFIKLIRSRAGAGLLLLLIGSKT